jgi:uncharacterized membrane protein
MDFLLLLLRILHIGTGVIWVGAAFTFFLFVAPSANVLAPPNRKQFFDEIIARRRFPVAITILSTVTILAGAILYWRDSSGLNPAWITSPTGLGFTVGALAAIVSWLLGPLAIKPTIEKLDHLGGELLAAGRPPTPEEGGRMQALSSRLQTVGRIDLAVLSVAVIAMAVARYLR